MPNNEEELLEEESVLTEETPEVTEDVQPADEEPASSIGQAIEQHAKDKAKAELTKKAAALLFKNPYFWLIVGLALFIGIIAILIFAMDFDLFGTGEVKPGYYSPTCEKVYYTWENEDYIEEQKKLGTYKEITDPALVDLEDTDRFSYKEYDYDAFVSGIIWYDNNAVGDVKNEVVYEAMSIAARTRVIKNLGANCVALKDNHEENKVRLKEYVKENFVELAGQEDLYSEITGAVKNTKGIIIGDENKELLNTEYDAFSFISKKLEADTGIFFYHMMNANEEGQQIVPAYWVEENGISPSKVFLIKKFESMSLYGAKYLLEKEDSQYELYRILEFYYGRDIEYYTIYYDASDGGMGGSGCMWWPIGSALTTAKDGKIFASGEPETTKITSYFGLRDAPKEGASTNHGAIDIGGGRNTETNIIAAADGVVTKVITGCVEGDSGCGGKLGNYVMIKHNDGTYTRYGHMYSVSVSHGQNVKQGEVIGKMGNTGNSTGPHLHFEVHVNGVKVDPLNYVSTTNTRPDCSWGDVTPGGDVAQTVCLTLKNNGYSNNAIAGVMGNFYAESGMNPNAVNEESGAFGLAQWLGGRQDNLRNMYGAKCNLAESQMSFLLYELNGSENATEKYIRGDHSIDDMAFNFCKKFERPEAGVCESGAREGFARNYYGYITNGCQ